MSENGDKFTPTEQRIMNRLADGLAHTISDLKRCLDDELAGRTAVPFHINQIRKKLRRRGEDIVCYVQERTWSYLHVRLSSARQ